MWERRYGFPKPLRNGNNIRIFSSADIERLTRIARLIDRGFRIRELAHKSIDELDELLGPEPQSSPRPVLRASSDLSFFAGCALTGLLARSNPPADVEAAAWTYALDMLRTAPEEP